MYVKQFKRSRSEQLRLIEYFVASTAVRTAADLVEIH